MQDYIVPATALSLAFLAIAIIALAVGLIW